MIIQLQSRISAEQLPLVVTQCLFHVSNTSEYAQLRPEAAIIVQFCVALAVWDHEIFVYATLLVQHIVNFSFVEQEQRGCKRKQ